MGPPNLPVQLLCEGHRSSPEKLSVESEGPSLISERKVLESLKNDSGFISVHGSNARWPVDS
jgi:hypothetical protein